MFKKKTPIISIIIAAAALLAAFYAWYFRPVTLNVALYSYVPDKARFETSVRSVWEEEHPGVGLHFVEWNCYVADLPEDLDVFVFDCAFLSDYIDDGLLLPLSENEIADAGDISPSALPPAERMIRSTPCRSFRDGSFSRIRPRILLWLKMKGGVSAESGILFSFG